MEACLFMNNGTVIINFTIGFGNNLFQYSYGRLLAEKNGMLLHHRAIKEMGIRPEQPSINKNLPTLFIDDNNYKKVLFSSNLQKCNVVINGYFEDYKILKPHLDDIRSWFTHPPVTNTEDLILHLRLQNRLIQINHNKNHISADAFKRAIGKFDYKRLHIVTDAEKWEPYIMSDIEKIRHEIKVGPNPPNNSPWVDPEQSLEYINHLIGGLSELEPTVHCNGKKVIYGSGGLRGGFIDDFNLLRSFNQVIIHNSTFSWWAATLSGASKVGIFSPWKIAKTQSQRRNLGNTNYPGWLSWGGEEDLYFKKYGIKQ